MTDFQPSLTDRIDDRERYNVNLSKTSYLTILFALEGDARDLIGDLTVGTNVEEAERKIETITEMMNSLSEFAIYATEFDAKKSKFTRVQ